MNSPSINTVAISGRMGDQEREAQVGNSHVVENQLLFDQPAKDGETKEAWIELQGWGNVGDAMARIPAGHEVIVNGSLNRRAWKDKEDNWRERYSIRVLQIQEMGSVSGETLFEGTAEPEEEKEELPFS